jgi:hypothetical protein
VANSHLVAAKGRAGSFVVSLVRPRFTVHPFQPPRVAEKRAVSAFLSVLCGSSRVVFVIRVSSVSDPWLFLNRLRFEAALDHSRFTSSVIFLPQIFLSFCFRTFASLRLCVSLFFVQAVKHERRLGLFGF